ncbi:MAG: response regulator [Ignavibacteriae bacterium]|nr:response regulator [Ignavibacteriota bacterium]
METLNILLVEDNFEHLRLTKYILKRNNVPGEVYVVRDGQEAVDFLYHRNQFHDTDAWPRPHLVLLDLNIPRIDGKEVLRIMKEDRSLNDIPVIVVSSSDRDEDVSFAYQLGASAYISKSDGFEMLSQALSSIHRFAAKEEPRVD